jgi:hypothetical protein
LSDGGEYQAQLVKAEPARPTMRAERERESKYEEHERHTV